MAIKHEKLYQVLERILVPQPVLERLFPEKFRRRQERTGTKPPTTTATVKEAAMALLVEVAVTLPAVTISNSPASEPTAPWTLPNGEPEVYVDNDEEEEDCDREIADLHDRPGTSSSGLILQATKNFCHLTLFIYQRFSHGKFS